MVGQAKRRLERFAGLKRDIGEIGDARRQPLDMSSSSTKPHAVVRVCRPENSQISLIEGKMDVFIAEEVEHGNFGGLNSHATNS